MSNGLLWPHDNCSSPNLDRLELAVQFSTSFSVNGPNIQALLRGPDGAVANDVRRRTNRVLNEAKRLAPVDKGTLRASLRAEMLEDGRGVYGVVTSPLDYALYVHNGTRFQRPQPFLLDALPAANQ